MSAAPFQIRHLRGRLDEEALEQKRIRLFIESAAIHASEQGLRRVIPGDAPAKLEKLAQGGVILRVDLPFVSALARIQVFKGPEGLLSVELVEVEAGILPVPASLAAAIIREYLPSKPWLLQRPGTRWDVDIPALARSQGLELPALSAVRVNPLGIDLEFGG